MARYTASPFGVIHGKLGKVVGSVWKGITYARKDFTPTNPNTVPQQAIRYICRVLTKFIARHFEKNTKQIWNTLATDLKLPLTGGNLFSKKSSRVLWKSTQSGVVSPDWTLLRVSDGLLEPSQEILSASYTQATGALTITWDPNIYRNGSVDDNAIIVIYQDAAGDAILTLSGGNSWLLGTTARRGDGTTTVNTVPNLPPQDLTVFLYFHDGIANYSPSTPRGRSIMQARDAIHHWNNSINVNSSSYIKVHEFKIYREQNYRAYKLLCHCKNATFYFRLKSGIEGDIDSNEISGVADSVTVREVSKYVSSQNEYITVEIWSKNLGSGQARLESGNFYGFA